MIQVKCFTFNPFSENTYVVWDDSGECLVIDPGCSDEYERNELTSFLTGNKLQPVKLINTHCHIDHVFGNLFIKNLYKIPFYIHKNDLEILKNAVQVGQLYGVAVEAQPDPDHFMVEGDKLKFGESTLDIVFTPGHSPGSVCLIAKKEKFVIAGDVLFNGSIGRTDLPGGDFNTLINSIKTKLFTLSDDYTVYAGHMEKTTIGHERYTNPFLLT